MAKGTIKKIVADKGFGFISTESGDLFFHRSGGGRMQIRRIARRAKCWITEGTGQNGPCSVPHRADAREILQETVVALWRQFDTYDTERPFLN